MLLRLCIGLALLVDIVNEAMTICEFGGVSYYTHRTAIGVENTAQ
tara:strand:- start:77 stop:211 length:135 start_codon:yes stop_codon:yes gene_type:complete